MRIFLSLFALSFSLLLGAQSGLNVIVDLTYPRPRITNMLVDNDTIVVYGLGRANNSELTQGVVFAKIDTTGQTIVANIVLDSLGDKLATDTDWGKIIKTSDGGYAATAATVFRKSAFLIKLSHNLQVEFIKEYPDTVNLSNFDYNLIEVTGGYLLFGSIQALDYYHDGFVKYVDQNGTLIWELNFANTLYDNRVLDIGKINDSNFVCVTVEGITPFSFFEVEHSRSGIYSFNLQGEITNTWQSEIDPEIGYLRKVIPLEDGAFITYGLAPKNLVNVTWYVQPTLARFDEFYSINWIHPFGNIRSFSALHTLWDFTQTIDGHFVGSGKISVKTGDEPSRGNGWLYKFSAEGDSIWGRNFPTPFPDVFPYTGTLYGVGALSSGCIIAGGTATDTQYNYCWIVKMTNDGCMDTLFCQITATTDLPHETQDFNILAYPNPAHDFLNLAYPEIPQPARLRLFDLHGRMVHQQALPPFSEQMVIDTRLFSPGIYFIEIQRATNAVERMKIVITH